jgi:hypothetical protein
VPTINATTVTATSYHELVESTCGSLAPSGKTRLCMDSADHTLKSSVNGAAYAAIGGSTSSGSTATSLVGPLNSTDVILRDE